MFSPYVDLTKENQEVNNSTGVNPTVISDDEEESVETAVERFWPNVMEEIRSIKRVNLNERSQSLPLSRIKKIMKLDDSVKMVGNETTILLSKALEMFISELTLRSFVHTNRSGRQTLQRKDIVMASKDDEQFDFLIDLLPRDEKKCRVEFDPIGHSTDHDVNYYLKLLHQHDQQQKQQKTNNAFVPGTEQAIQIIPLVTSQGSNWETCVTSTSTGNQPQVIQLLDYNQSLNTNKDSIQFISF